MTTDLTLVKTSNSLETIADQINASHSESKKAANYSVLNMVRVGLLCMDAKAKLKHGKFLPWIADNCPHLSSRSARNYIKLIEEAQHDLSQYLPLEEIVKPEFLSRYEVEKDFARQIDNSMDAFSMGRGVTDLYIEYGVIRRNKLDTDGTNNPNGLNGTDRPTLPPTKEQREQMAFDYFYGDPSGEKFHPESPVAKIIFESSNPQRLVDLPSEHRQKLANELIEAGKRIQKLD